MSEEMAVSDNTAEEQANLSGDEAAPTTVSGPEEVAPELPGELLAAEAEESPTPLADSPPPEVDPEEQGEPAEPCKVKQELDCDEPEPPAEPLAKDTDNEVISGVEVSVTEMSSQIKEEEEVDMKAIKRRASEAFSDNGDEEFKGFEEVKEIRTEDYNRILERLEAEVTAARKSFTPLRTVMATPPAPTRASKRPRKDTEGSRPSSALSSRSEGDGSTDASPARWSPAARGGRRATTEMSSPLLRVPLERGWKRELVYRAALDAHSRRNADIYYYTPHGKKLRSTREVGEHLAGTGLTLENFSFFKEPLGVDDPEKEIIRDAKLIRRVESPIAATTPSTPVEGKRTPKPKVPKGASPEPQPNVSQAAATVKSPPAKIKVKSVGSRLSGSTPTSAATKQQASAPAAPATPATPAPPTQKKPAAPQGSATTDNNNSAAWKKPRPPPQQPPPLASRPTDSEHHTQEPQVLVQPCSMTCGRGVPSLSCAACLCLYHPACVGHHHVPAPDPFLCKNCRKSTSPPLEPPPLTHKSGVPPGGLPVPVPVPVPVVAPVPRRVPVPVPVPAKVPRDKRVLLRMKVAGGTPDGERVWAVSDQTQQPSTQPQPAQPKPSQAQPAQPSQPVVPQSVQALGRARGPRPSLPQSLAVLNGRRFIIVPRSMVHAQPQ